jgi:hypothetical protein
MTQSISLGREFLPWGVRVAAGKQYGQSHDHKYGYNAAAGTTAETVWLQGAAYTWPAAAAILEITSSDDTDDDIGGDGALTVVVEGLDANYNEISNTVIMEGFTAVNTDDAFFRVNRMYVATAGVNGTNTGVIYASTGAQTNGVPDVATTIRATIGAGLAQTQQCFYTVPAGKQAHILGLTFTSTDVTNSCTFDFLIREAGSTVWKNKGRSLLKQATHFVRPDIPQVFAAGTDIDIQATASASDVAATAEMDILLLDV